MSSCVRHHHGIRHVISLNGITQINYTDITGLKLPIPVSLFGCVLGGNPIDSDLVDEKSDIRIEKHPLLAEIENVRKQFRTFLISALLLMVTFQMSVHFLDAWTLCPKKGIVYL